MTDSQREDVPRISVDNLHDWERIKKSYADAAMAELEERMAKEDRFKTDQDKEVLRIHLRKFVERTFEMSKMNLRINGRNFEDLNEEEQGGIDPFDEGLDRHIWSLSDQSLQWDGEIARKRREKPIEVERLMKELVEARQAVDEEEEEAYKKVNDAPESAANFGDGEDKEDDTEEFEVSEQVEEIARRTFAIADELQQSVKLQQERSERLKRVEAEIKALKP